MLKGGSEAKRWQPMSAAIWCSPRSSCTSFIAAKIGRSGQPVQKPGGRIGTVFDRSGISAAGAFGARTCAAAARRGLAQEGRDPVEHHLPGVFARHRQHVLAVQRTRSPRPGRAWAPAPPR
jgi:hypothetical protein